ncbi:MAG: hypothetical protein QOF70_2341 [Acetobacteraceae bacterium]|nr:hypothetical protein [Acetobacteraceae bacterium]
MFHGPSRISLGEALSQHESGYTFGASDITTAVRNHTLRNVVLDTNSLILWQEGQAIAETVYFEPWYAFLPVAEPAELTVVPDDEDLIFGYNNAHWGYQHWLTQCLPAIDWSLRQKRTRGVRLILPRLELWQEEFLALLGYDLVPRLTPQAGARYQFSRVEYSEFLTGGTSFAICLSTLDTARRIAEAVPSLPSSDRILYIDEVTPSYGAIRNEGAVIDLLRRLGVTIVERGRLGVAERINLFRNADVVIGPHSGGLSDVLFCRPGTLLWEWMPRHHQNASANRLAQAAGLDYWGDLFEAVVEPVKPGQWAVDLDIVERRLTELSVRLADRGGVDTAARLPSVTAGVASRAIDDLVLDFESLGDNCEFGLVQRQAGVEPPGLLTFNDFLVAPEQRLEKLVGALERGFDGLGTIRVFAEDVRGRRELIASESVYGLRYSTGIAEGAVEPEVQAGLETVRLGGLRDKLLRDLKSGGKTWVWKSRTTTHRNQMQPLLEILRRLGPNTVLWVVEANDEHQAGSVERLEPGLIKGYVSRFAPYDGVTDIDFASWWSVCWRADELLHADRVAPEPEPEGRYEAPPRPLSAMELLTRDSPVEAEVRPAAEPEGTGAPRILRWFRRR